MKHVTWGQLAALIRVMEEAGAFAEESEQDWYYNAFRLKEAVGDLVDTVRAEERERESPDAD